jgi:hypothetical protein
MTTLDGMRFGRWTVIGERAVGSRKWPCRCDCGTERLVYGPSLLTGESKSCGCLSAELAAGRATGRVRHPVSPGDAFGRLTVIDATDRASVLCRCECGREHRVTASNLVGNQSRSCGCLKREMISARFRKHGLGYEDYRYRLWGTLMAKCYRQTCRDYGYYGGRGITVYQPWHDAATFIADIDRLLGPRPDGFTLDRIDNNGNYEPGNVWWATRKQQTGNRRVSVRKEAP